MNPEQESDYKDKIGVFENIIHNLSLFLFFLDKNRYFIDTYNAPEAVKGNGKQLDIIGKPLNSFTTNPDHPFYDACIQISQVVNQVLETGIPVTIQYAQLDRMFEAIISRISDEMIMGEARDITEASRDRHLKETKRQNELAMALTAGGIASWCYETATDLVTSTHQNDITGATIPHAELLKRVIPEHRELLLTLYDNLLKKGSAREKVTLQALNQQGDVRWYTLHAIPDSYAPNGEVISIIGSQKDVTDEYKRQELLKHTQEESVAATKLLLTLIDFIPCPLYIKDAENDFRYIIANQLFCKENQLTKREIIGKNDFEICSEEKALASYQQDLTVLRNNSVYTFEEHTVQNNSARIWQTTKACFTSTESRKLLVGIMLDITDKTNALEQMSTAKKMAERSDKFKSAFLANMSHEIRTPLNAIVGFSQLLSVTEEKQEREVFINIINSNSEQLLALINDILDLSKIESGYIDCKNDVFQLNRLMNDLEVTFALKMLPSVNLICKLPAKDHWVNLDKSRVSQILVNFITNAIKFTTKGSIEFGYHLYKDGIKLFVKDTGIGIAEENLPKVFDRFEKFDPFKQGTGLGTAICKAIIDAYNGEIGVTSKVGEGSYFWAYLPTEIR